MSSTFINEAECYTLFERYGLTPPRYIFIGSIDSLNSTPFKDGEDVVFKAVVDDVWHKSDLGLVSFSRYSKKSAEDAFKHFSDLNPKKENWKGMLVCEKVQFAESQLPCEILLSVKQDASCGAVVSIGFGGIHTELWGNALKDGVLNFMVELTKADEAFDELSAHLLGKILLGKVRGGEACVNEKNIKSLLTSVWQLAADLQKEGLTLVEINPLVVDQEGLFVAIDGVAERIKPVNAEQKIRKRKFSSEAYKALFNPVTFLVVGVSSKKKAFGNIILDNLKNSDIDQKSIRVLKPASNDFDGFQTIDTLHELADPVDALILAVPALAAIDLIKEAFKSNKAKVIHLVSGGIGDGADHNGLKEQLNSIIDSCPSQNRPIIIGPNSLGMVLSPQKINTLFIPQNKLPVSFYPDGNIGLIAQSGAFFITRISKNNHLPIRYGLCIGNQIDITATDIVEHLAADKKIDVIALYLEGAPGGNAHALAKAIKNISKDKKVVLYRSGRSSEGMKAASGHTGALASDYSIEKKLLQKAGAIICESFDHFEICLKWYSAYPRFEKLTHGVSVMSNTGYESVASADGLGKHLAVFSERTKKELTGILTSHKLSEIVTATNPLDITPMASDDVYYECSRKILQAEESEMLILGLVPLTVMIETDDENEMNRYASRLKQLSTETKKPIAVIIDAGIDYLKLKQCFTEKGLPVFNSIQDLFRIII